MERIEGFSHIVHGNDRVLILGSIPSVKSLEENMYYAHKSNRFWQVLSTLYGMPYGTKEEKLEILKENKIALWDVCHSCIREKSADSTIKRIIVNDIPGLLKDNPSIEIVICNGKTCFTTLQKHFPEIDAISCPSTSSANAQFRLDDLVQAYKGAGL